MPFSIKDRLAAIGIALPAASVPGGAYASRTSAGELLFISGQIATTGGRLTATGTVGGPVDIATGQDCARACALNILAQLDSAAGPDGTPNILKLTVFIASAPGFTQQPLIADAASQLISEVLGEARLHSRSVVGVVALPFDSPVEIEAIATISGNTQ